MPGSLQPESTKRIFISVKEGERKKLKIAFNDQFLQNTGKGNDKWYGSQTGTVMALQFGMVPDSVKRNVVQGLQYDIEENKKGHHSTGIHGNRYIYSVLNDLGKENLSFGILTHPEFPSQAYILNCGFRVRSGTAGNL